MPCEVVAKQGWHVLIALRATHGKPGEFAIADF